MTESSRRLPSSDSQNGASSRPPLHALPSMNPTLKLDAASVLASRSQPSQQDKTVSEATAVVPPRAPIAPGTIKLSPDALREMGLDPEAPNGTVILPPSAAPTQPGASPATAVLPPGAALPPPPPFPGGIAIGAPEVGALDMTAPAPPFSPPPAFEKMSLPPVTSDTRTGARPRVAQSKVSARAVIASSLGLLLLLCIASYAGVQLVFASNRSWVAPTLLSASDPRVVQVTAMLQQENGRKSELLLHEKELEGRLRDAQRWVEVEQAFQASYKAALRSDLEGQKSEVRRLQGLLASAATSDADQAAALKSADLETRIAGLKQRMRVVEGALRDVPADGSALVDTRALTMRRQVDLSMLAAEKARDLTQALDKAIAEASQALADKDALIKSIESSPYRLATKGDVAFGFVPYDNFANAKKGTPLVACQSKLLFCKPVGTIEEMLPGEVRASHPTLGHELRGQLARLSLKDTRAVERPMLFAGKAPFGL